MSHKHPEYLPLPSPDSALLQPLSFLSAILCHVKHKRFSLLAPTNLGFCNINKLQQGKILTLVTLAGFSKHSFYFCMERLTIKPKLGMGIVPHLSAYSAYYSAYRA